MKNLQIIAWASFILGVAFKILHFPRDSILLLLGTLLLMIHSIIYLIKKAKTDLPNAILHLSCAFLSLYILFRLQFWNVGPAIAGFPLLFIIVFILSITCLILLIIRKVSFKFS